MKKLLTLFAICCSLCRLQAQNAPESPLLAGNTNMSLSANYPEDADEPAGTPAYHDRYGHRRRHNLPLGSNVVTGSPINLTVVNGYACYAFGFSYEHLFGPEQIIGIQVPIHFAFGTNDILYDDDKGKFFYTTPGLQVHVAGARRGFDYAVGPSLLLGNLYEQDNYYSNGNKYTRSEKNTFTTGIILDNNLNFQRRSFLFGIHISLGTTFPNSAYDSKFFFQAGMRFGGRF